MAMFDDADEATEATRPVPAVELPPGTARYRLVVVGEGTPLSHVLPEGNALIGRSAETDIQVDEPSLSRRHAMITVGPRVQVQDLGSLNGTRVRGARLTANEPVEVNPGDVIELGSVMVIVQRAEVPRAPRRLWPHGYFDARLEEECLRAQRTGRSFAVVRMRFPPEVTDEQVESALDVVFKATSLVANFSPRDYELLLEDAGAAAARQLCEQVQLRLKGGAVATGVAVHPDDGRSAAELMDRAGAALRGTTPLVTAEQAVAADGSPMERLRALIERVAQSTISVILQGETGVGKEVAARMIHRFSRRSDKPFVAINCGALAEALLESELFGHERGAFTGAVKAKPGLLETADGGTIFLDEVGEMPAALQVKLLRVLEERAVVRVGAVKPRPIDVRVLTATHRNLEEMVAHGRFRQDLIYRLNGITLSIPPLRERTDELEGLVRTFVEQFARAEGKTRLPTVDPLALQLMRSYAWPGNVRELRNVVERAVTLCTGEVISLDHLPVEKMGMMLQSAVSPSSSTPVPTPSPAPPPRVPRPSVFEPIITSPTLPTAPSAMRTGIPNPTVPAFRLPTPAPVPPSSTGPQAPASPRQLKDALKAVERERILEALNACGGNQSRAAEVLGMSRRALVNRLEEYGLPRPRKRDT
ncbi:MAG: sigma 54-interacting transcriptional regulator [Myxococcota bacterium]